MNLKDHAKQLAQIYKHFFPLIQQTDEKRRQLETQTSEKRQQLKQQTDEEREKLEEQKNQQTKAAIEAYEEKATAQCLKTLTEYSYILSSVAFSPDGRTLASGSYQEIKLWDAGSGQLKQTLKGHDDRVHSVAFSPDGSTLASGSGELSEYGEIKLWDAGSGKLQQTLTGHSSYVESVAFSPDGRTLASGSGELSKYGEIKLWDAGSGKLQQTLTGHSDYVFSVAFSPDGRTLASGSRDDTINLWDAGSGQLQQTLTGHSYAVVSVAFSPDGRTLASGSEKLLDFSEYGEIKLWDAGSGQLKQTLTGHSASVFSVAFSPDGRTLASGSDDKTIKLWDAGSGQLKKTLTGHSDAVSSVAFSPDGRTLASGSDDHTIKLWNCPLISDIIQQVPKQLQKTLKKLKQILQGQERVLQERKQVLATKNKPLEEAQLLLSKAHIFNRGKRKRRVWEAQADRDQAQANCKQTQSQINNTSWAIQTRKDHIETLETIKSNYESGLATIEQNFQTETKKLTEHLETETKRLTENLKNTLEGYQNTISKAQKLFAHHPETHTLSASAFASVLANQQQLALPYLRLGDLKLVSPVDNTRLQLPWVLPFLNSGNILFECRGKQNIGLAKQVVHGAITRLLMALPAGKVKFTFIDPVGAGQQVSPFLGLNEDIYGKKVWTEPGQIEKQLFDIARHMENVIQKYLKDEYKDLAAYNAKAGEVEEPFRVLVIFNFPEGFNDTTAAKLRSIMQNGARTGVHTLLVVDTKLKMPYDFSLDSLAEHAENLVFEKGESRLANYKNNTYLLAQDSKEMPIKAIVEHVNKGFARLDTVKVPFEQYLPAAADWWSGTIKLSEFSNEAAFYEVFGVPIGRQGAKDTQIFHFDNKDKAHALLVGRSGSGKSNLLHILITNALLRYSPDQLELYLIDFKEGVEFVIYAENEIPHAKTIAIESEREFGLSVLQGLEKELLKRGNTFKNKGIQNLAEMHQRHSSTRMPRILLIVDEFQVFFNEDDVIATKALKIFDNLVRKGRSYGINILLATQSLSGNLSSFKSLMHSIAVRLALMCSDSDSRVVLSDDNADAKLLTRPGEGIYNAMGGLIEGNNRFQTFFMEKEKHEAYIAKLKAFTKKKGYKRPDKQIIFRGDSLSYLEANETLATLAPLAKPKSIRLWLGEPVTIDEDVCAIFRKQSGSNLLVVGLAEELTTNLLICALISIVLQHEAESAAFYFLNFLNVDEEIHQYPKAYFGNIPFKTTFGKNKDVEKILESLKAEVEQRLENETGGKNIYLTLFATQRGRKFRKGDFDSLSPAGTNLSFILREGPDVGVFVLMHADTLNNMDRCFESGIRNEFAQRVALQMSADDSTNLLDTSSAAKLGNNRAYYYDETEGILKKLKPYTQPNQMWFENKIG